MTDRPLLTDVLPEIADTLEQILLNEGEAELAATVRSLRFYAPCACGEDTCESFYTAPKPSGSAGPGHRNVMLFWPRGGLLALEVVDGEICSVSILG